MVFEISVDSDLKCVMYKHDSFCKYITRVVG